MTLTFKDSTNTPCDRISDLNLVQLQAVGYFLKGLLTDKVLIQLQAMFNLGLVLATKIVTFALSEESDRAEGYTIISNFTSSCCLSHRRFEFERN